MTIEEFVEYSKIRLEDLIDIAEKSHMSIEIIRKLKGYLKTYKNYTQPFNKKSYIETMSYVIDGKKVKPTEQDVERCIEYLKANHCAICFGSVERTVSKYLRGKLDITRKEETVGKNDERTQLKTLEDKQENLKNTLEQVEQLESNMDKNLPKAIDTKQQSNDDGKPEK